MTDKEQKDQGEVTKKNQKILKSVSKNLEYKLVIYMLIFLTSILVLLIVVNLW